jgi:enoyl-CoA hydratase/carnithine racemase
VTDSVLAVTESKYAVIASVQHAARRNAISLQVISALGALVERLTESAETRPFLLRGDAGWFASGGDLREFAEMTAADAGEMVARMGAVLRAVEDLVGPTVAVLNGPAIGGGAEMALAFDIRVAVDTAYLRFPEAQLGLTTGWQGAERLAETVGYSTALELLLTGRKVSAAEGLAIRLLNAVFPESRFERNVDDLTRTLYEAGGAGRAMKGLLQTARRRGRTDGSRERDAFVELWSDPRRRLAMESALVRKNERGIANSDEHGDNVKSRGLGK